MNRQTRTRLWGSLIVIAALAVLYWAWLWRFNR